MPRSLPFIIEAGAHTRRETPVSLDLPTREVGRVTNRTRFFVLDPATGVCVPAQRVDSGERTIVRVAFVLDRLDAHSSCSLELHVGKAPRAQIVQHEVELDDASGTLEVRIGEQPFTAYHYGPEWARPFLYPLLGPRGERVTRGYPVESHKGESKDHPHHKSVWFAHGDLNGSDNWSEEKGHGRQMCIGLGEVVSGPVFGSFLAKNRWLDNNGETVVLEQRRLTFWGASPLTRIVDVKVIFRATNGDVTFGDTKEGGILSVRLASSMDVSRGGRIVNAHGGVNEAETWGKRSPWCDYSGPVDGGWVGVTVMDHEDSFRHPTYWHVRDYGLMTANPFGLSHYYDDESRDGSHLLPSGEEIHFHYRLLVHAGDDTQGAVHERYHDFIHPPRTRID